MSESRRPFILRQKEKKKKPTARKKGPLRLFRCRRKRRKEEIGRPSNRVIAGRKGTEGSFHRTQGKREKSGFIACRPREGKEKGKPSLQSSPLLSGGGGKKGGARLLLDPQQEGKANFLHLNKKRKVEKKRKDLGPVCSSDV